MAEVTKEDVESMRNALESNGGKEYNAKIGGREFNYLVVPRNLGPGELPNFAMQKFSDDLSSYVIGVSDNLHQSYRPFKHFMSL
ncbi:MAG: hypothetical protein ABEI74_00205 [Candidatus Pacearchaeota archaeon]